MAKNTETKTRKRRLGDRSDGHLIRKIDPMNRLMPYLMKTRNDALNTFAETISIGKAERYCREKIRQGYTDFGMLHVLLAAYVRTIAQYPAINRFISGQKIYARNNIEVVMAIKKEMSIDAPETMIDVIFDHKATALDVYNEFNAHVVENKGVTEDDSSFDKLVTILNFIPGFLLRFVVWLLECLDYIGCLPKFLLRLSPFHGSMIITSMGSLGIKPIYHHLYNFGNLPVFISYGMKRDELYMNRDGEVKKKRVIDVKVVTDERICDGFYYAAAFKTWKRYIENPEELDTPIEEVKPDID